MKIGLLGGLRVEHSAQLLHVSGAMQLALLFRLAIDAGTAVSYRAIAEDIWSTDAPENTRAALQSIVSRLRTQLPAGSIESTPGGYRLAVARSDVDALTFQDAVAAAIASAPEQAARLATDALALWRGEPWIPSDDFGWFARDLLADRETALGLGGIALLAETASRIPAPLTSLVGRERELETIAEQLANNRLVTILGTGGAGKTRLALEAARIRVGSILVELASVGAGDALSAVLAATGREIRGADSTGEATEPRARVIEALVSREALVVLDNCEHIIDTVAAMALDLLGALPNLRILATSREPLGVPGEAFVPVGSLDSERAQELFLQRAASATGAELAELDHPAVALICERLDGLPLAIELAAARLRTMTVDEVLAGLDDRFALLTGGFRTALPRHQTLRAMIDWSWSLLSADERNVLSRFAVYPAGAEVSDAALIARSMGADSVSVFDSLVDRSLLQRTAGRYRELETIREYGIERLSATGDLADARVDQVRIMVESAARHDEMLRGPGIHDAISWFDAEEDNLAAALRFATQAQLAEEAIGLAVSCFWYWTIRDREADSRAWMTAVGPLAGSVNTDAARLIHLISPVVAAFSGTDDHGQDDEEEIALALASLPMFEVSTSSPAIVQLAVPLIAAFSAEVGSEGWMTRVRVPRGEELGLAPWPTAVLNVVRSAIAQNRGDVDGLGEASSLAVSQFEQLGDWWGLALAQQMRAEWFSAHGLLGEALEMTEASTENMRRITSSWDLAQQRALAVSLLTRMGRKDEARQRVHDLVAEAEESGNIRTIAQVSVTALIAHVGFGEAVPARRHLERFEGAIASLPRMPGQMLAGAEMGRAGIAMLEGDPDAAERALRAATGHAIASHDHPIIGGVALELGMLALSRGDVPEAARALEVATAILGAKDPTDHRVLAIESAAATTGVGRAGELPTRPAALEAFEQLLR